MILVGSATVSFTPMRFPLLKHFWLTLLALTAGVCLRLWFLYSYPDFQGDPLIYGGIAKNWLLHGIYGLGYGDGIRPTLIRLPGYPLFLAACFRIFGMEHYHAVVFVQIAIDLVGCLLLAALAARLWSPEAAWWALWLSVLCPFTANYAAVPLTETLELFAITLAFYTLVRFLAAPQPRWLLLLALCWSYASLLRPDGALLAAALCPALYFYGRRRWTSRRMWHSALLASLLAVLPFIPWTMRNWKTFHVFQPLAPRYAVDPGESSNPGFNRWIKTVCADLACTWEVYWNVDSDIINPASLPVRAFNTPAVRASTMSLLADYNRTTTLTPALDARFAALAAERIHAHPLEYYLALPMARLADMWLRPRTELLWIELRWWQYQRHPHETEFALAYAGLNLAYLAAAFAGLLRKPPLAGAMLAFILLRCALLATLEAPEPRYTLECYPLVFVLAAVACTRRDPALTFLPAAFPEPPAG